MHEPSDLDPQDINGTLVRFYTWAKQCERNVSLDKPHRISTAKTEKDAQNDAWYVEYS